MFLRQAAFQLISVFFLAQTREAPLKISLTVAERGTVSTLTCNVSGKDPSLFYWYKMKFGQIVERLGSATHERVELEEKYKGSKFRITKAGDVYSLTIRNVTNSDEGTFFCLAGGSFKMDFVNTTEVVVKEPINEPSTAYVRQSPAEWSVLLGGSVTLQCSLVSMCSETADQCPSEHSVHWFRAGSEPNQGFIYNVSNHQQKNGTCHYYLSKTMSDPSEAGMYYCAAVTCGKILFGEGTQLKIRQEMMFIFALGTLCICSMILNIFLIIMRKTKCGHRGAAGPSLSEHKETRNDQPNNVDNEEVEINYVAVNFTARKNRRNPKHRDVPEECIYSFTKLN